VPEPLATEGLIETLARGVEDGLITDDQAEATVAILARFQELASEHSWSVYRALGGESAAAEAA